MKTFHAPFVQLAKVFLSETSNSIKYIYLFFQSSSHKSGPEKKFTKPTECTGPDQFDWSAMLAGLARPYIKSGHRHGTSHVGIYREVPPVRFRKKFGECVEENAGSPFRRWTVSGGSGIFENWINGEGNKFRFQKSSGNYREFIPNNPK